MSKCFFTFPWEKSDNSTEETEGTYSIAFLLNCCCVDTSSCAALAQALNEVNHTANSAHIRTDTHPLLSLMIICFLRILTICSCAYINWNRKSKLKLNNPPIYLEMLSQIHVFHYHFQGLFLFSSPNF